MSRKVMSRILAELGLKLSLREEEELYRELLRYFGLIGGTDECTALERAWEDPYVKGKIKEFILEWLKRKRAVKQEQEAYVC